MLEGLHNLSRRSHRAQSSLYLSLTNTEADIFSNKYSLDRLYDSFADPLSCPVDESERSIDTNPFGWQHVETERRYTNEYIYCVSPVQRNIDIVQYVTCNNVVLLPSPAMHDIPTSPIRPSFHSLPIRQTSITHTLPKHATDPAPSILIEAQ